MTYAAVIWFLIFPIIGPTVAYWWGIKDCRDRCNCRCHDDLGED